LLIRADLPLHIFLDDDTEISFAVGEMITEIVVVDENWWQGKNSSGLFGMFPSSYVQSQ